MFSTGSGSGARNFEGDRSQLETVAYTGGKSLGESDGLTTLSQQDLVEELAIEVALSTVLLLWNSCEFM